MLISGKLYFMKLSKTLLTALVLTVSTTFFYACQRETSSSTSENKARMQVFLTDDPGNYEEVIIDVKDILVNYSSDSSNGWQSMGNVNAGSYDILKLVNDNDTLLADAELNTGRIQQIRLVLGPNNFVKVGGQTYPLSTPSAQQSGLKLNIHQDVNAGVLYKLLLDFDASRSIVKTGNNKYILKPVIRTSLVATGGTIKGFVKPSAFNTTVYAIKGTDTVAGTQTAAGSYVLRGLPAGSYNLSFIPADTSYNTGSKTGITVTNNQVTTVDTLVLVQ